jgi:hypothetical protein
MAATFTVTITATITVPRGQRGTGRGFVVNGPAPRRRGKPPAEARVRRDHIVQYVRDLEGDGEKRWRAVELAAEFFKPVTERSVWIMLAEDRERPGLNPIDLGAVTFRWTASNYFQCEAVSGSSIAAALL